MFALRGIAVSFSVFLLVYTALSLAVCCVWRRVLGYAAGLPVRSRADFLFALRMFPWLVAVGMTAVLTVPSFLLLEPRAIQEPLGAAPLLLGMGGLACCVAGVVKAARALRRASRAIASWTNAAQPMPQIVPVPVLRIARTGPAMTAAGIVRSRVMFSSAAQSVLTRNELQMALNHEVAHVRKRDNLKKLFLLLAPFPGLAGLDDAWVEASEMAADDAAVSNVREALDLAAALIKISRLTPRDEPVELTAALVNSQRNPAVRTKARVERLIAWSGDEIPQTANFSTYGGAGMLALAALFAATYSHLLVEVHAATEWLVR
jgi:Zn-dependent protease with chaperone function